MNLDIVVNNNNNIENDDDEYEQFKKYLHNNIS
jgi:hypothetical protein